MAGLEPVSSLAREAWIAFAAPDSKAGNTPRASTVTQLAFAVTHVVVGRSVIVLMPAFRSRLLPAAATAVCLAIAGAGVAVALKSSNRGHRRRNAGVTSAARFPSCPTRAPRRLRSSRRGPNVTLVPSGTDQLLLCRYDGPFGGPDARIAHRFRLVAQRLIVDRHEATNLAGALNRLPRLPSGVGRECGQEGPTIVAFFRYPSGPSDPVSVQLAGCLTATNGHLTTEAAVGDFLDKLDALIHAAPAPGHPTGSAGTATIAGYVRLCGGPAPGRCFGSTIGGCAPDGCSRSDRVVAIDAAGDVIAQQWLRYPYPNGRFRLQVPPGQYVVELLADGPRIHDRLMQTKGATARAGHTATAVFTFDVP